MFFAQDRLPIVQEMILADNLNDREKALKKLLPLQREDFFGLFREMKGYPVTIRTLDPPLHEFLPKREELMVEIAKQQTKKTKGQGGKGSGENRKRLKRERLLARVEALHEFNPMLGLRGCRLGILYPEITRMQAQAIFEAACQLAKRGEKVRPEVMIPLVGHVNEFTLQKAIVVEVAENTMTKAGVRVDYSVGTMIEVPRGAITADEIAKEAEFFSFGTNDLTQMTFAYSRDDSGKFLKLYEAQGILEKDPFATLDKRGVGVLVKMGVEKGRAARPDLKIGICGEHGGDPASIEFCHQVGLDYVSCSPYRVPVARLAAAHAALRERKEYRQVGD
jgi:pyruvate,orthophosphate dikinase